MANLSTFPRSGNVLALGLLVAAGVLAWGCTPGNGARSRRLLDEAKKDLAKLLGEPGANLSRDEQQRVRGAIAEIGNGRADDCPVLLVARLQSGLYFRRSQSYPELRELLEVAASDECRNIAGVRFTGPLKSDTCCGWYCDVPVAFLGQPVAPEVTVLWNAIHPREQFAEGTESIVVGMGFPITRKGEEDAAADSSAALRVEPHGGIVIPRGCGQCVVGLQIYDHAGLFSEQIHIDLAETAAVARERPADTAQGPSPTKR